MNELGLSECFKEGDFEKSFSSFSSQRRLNAYVSENYSFVEPVEYVLGRDNITGKEHTMQYVPILDTRRALLEHDDVVAEVFEDRRQVDGRLKDFCDGSN